jgi:rare lipoprotein A (peptidoglycan hydrolase)
VVTVRNNANGRTATCVVTDRGPFPRGRIIDLDDDTFAQLAPLSSGVIDVTITW